MGRGAARPRRAGTARTAAGYPRPQQRRGLRRLSPYFGAIVGRYANRIEGARFRLDGKLHRLVPNENRNQLHGGPAGFGRRVWTLIDRSDASATLALVSNDGDMGYPGRLVATCTYALREPATLRIALEATCDRTTPVNLTTHAYYNLDGGPTILDHALMIAGDYVTPTRPGADSNRRDRAGRRHAFRLPQAAPDRPA